MNRPYALLVHGGAGNIGPARVAATLPGLFAALDAGFRLLKRGADALDAVEAACRTLEDDPRFNAGTGSVLTLDGTVETDASIMHGPTLSAGAVAALRGFRHPVSVARAVMERTDHVLLADRGAERFAASCGFETADLVTQERRRRHAKSRAKFLAGEGANARLARLGPSEPGTVGAIALDRRGACAAATSTGGMAMKLPGRVGDSAVIGAGTWADRTGCASATGTGEGILRTALAKSAVDLLALGIPAESAARAALARTASIGMSAGLLLLSAEGEPACAFTTRGMSAAWRRSGDGGPVAFPGARPRGRA